MIENDVNVSSTSIQSVSTSSSSSKNVHEMIPLDSPETPKRARPTSSRRHDGSSSSSSSTRVKRARAREVNKKRVNHTHLVGSPFAIVDRRILRDAPRKDGRDAMFNREERLERRRKTRTHTVFTHTLRPPVHILHEPESYVYMISTIIYSVFRMHKQCQ